MRGQAYYNDGESEQGIEVEIQPRKPMSDERFAAICQVICTLLICAATVAATYLVGTLAVIAAGLLAFFYILFTKID